MIKEDIKPGYAPAEVSFSGYTTKNLHHSEDAVKAFQDTIERVGNDRPHEVLAALKATDAFMKLNDMHLEQGAELDQRELTKWKTAHEIARSHLNTIGEFAHHMDYWHNHEHELQDMMGAYNPETAGAEMADSYEPQGDLVEAASPAARFNQKVKQAQAAHEAGDHKKAKYHLDTARNFMLGINSNDHSKIKDSYPKYKELRALHKEEVELDDPQDDSLTEEKHRIQVTVSDPNHPAVSLRKVKSQRFVKIPGAHSKDAALDTAKKYYKKMGLKVHSVEHTGMVSEESNLDKTSPGWMLRQDPKLAKKVKQKIELAKKRQATYGNPAAGKSVNEELTDKTIKSGDKIKVARVIADMLGVENAEQMSPENAVNAGLRKMKTKRFTPELVGVIKKMLSLAQEVGIKVDHSLLPSAVSEQADLEEEPVVDPTVKDNVARGILKLKDYMQLKQASDPHTKVGHSIAKGDGNLTDRHMKVKYATEAVQTQEGDEVSSDYKTDKSGRKYPAHRIAFDTKVQESKEEDDELSDDDLDSMASTIDHEDDILHLYDDDELQVVDQDTGEVSEVPNEQVDEQTLSEVLSRAARIKARIRFARTSSRRTARLKIVLKRRSDIKTLSKRAHRLAISMMKERLMRKPVEQMSVSEKERVEGIIANRKGAVARLAMRLIPRMAQIENARLSHQHATQSAGDTSAAKEQP